MWMLVAFEKKGGSLVHELPIRGIEVGTLRRLFSQPADDPMYYMYPVSRDIAEALADYVDGRIELTKYDYFLDYNAEP